VLCFFFFQAEDGIRDLVRSRGLGDVYKRQVLLPSLVLVFNSFASFVTSKTSSRRGGSSVDWFSMVVVGCFEQIISSRWHVVISFQCPLEQENENEWT